MTRVLLVGDLHLGKPLLQSVLGDAHAEQLDLVREQERAGRDAGCTHALMLGDLFDCANPSQDLMLGLLEVLAQSRLRWTLYPGNHDVDDVTVPKDDPKAAQSVRCSIKLLSRLPQFGAIRNVRFVMRPELVRVGEAAVYVVPWGHDFDVPRRADLVAIHDSVVGARNDNGRVVEPGHGVDGRLLRGKPTVSGHLHTPQWVRAAKTLYPGTAAQTSWGERPDKTLTALDVGRGRVRVVRVPWTPPWRLREVEWSAESPPKLDDDGAYYKVRVPSGERPDARWMIDNPRAVRVDGVKGEKRSRDVGPVESSADDGKRLDRYLAERTSLQSKQRRHALAIDARMGTSET